MDLKPHQIFETVCRKTSIKMREIMSDIRTPDIVTARALVVYFLRNEFNWTYLYISGAINKTNCYVLFKKIEFEKEVYLDIKMKINEIDKNLNLIKEKQNDNIINFLQK